MPIYANFYYYPKDRSFVPDGEKILAVVDRLLEERLIQFRPPEGALRKERKKGMLSRIREAVLGGVEEIKKARKAGDEIPPEPMLYTDPEDVGTLIRSRDDLAETEAITGSSDSFLRIELPYMGEALIERIEGRAVFELGFTLTRSPEPIPIIDSYENLQTGCKSCKNVFDPRDEMHRLTRVICPKCGVEEILAELKNTPQPPFARFIAALEHQKVVTPEEDDPAKTGLDLKDYSGLFSEVLGVKFTGGLLYT